MKSFILILFSFILFFNFSIYSNENTFKETSQKKQNKGELVIFHAGSLSVPFAQIEEAFNKKYPNINIIREAAGSRKCARKIADLHKKCDVFASADYSVINNLLIPEYANWNVKFVSNEMSIVYTEESKYANKINRENWHKILTRPDVVVGHSDPNQDPCGYRAILVMKLAAKYYEKPNLVENIQDKKDRKLIVRPKETDLISLLQTGNIDYIFLYRSVAEQHDLKFVKLPDKLNLSSEKYKSYYNKAEVKLSGKKPGSYIIKKGSPLLYGLTIPKNAPNYDNALLFLKFLLDKGKGLRILNKNGNSPVVPAYSKTYEKIPQQLKKYATSEE